MMFKVGDAVVYESLGVCTVTDIRTERFAPLEPQEYYVLGLVYGARTTVYAPVNNKNIRIRKVISKKEANAVIDSMPEEDTMWVEDENERKEKFRDVIRRGDGRELVSLIKALYNKREQQLAAGRKFHLNDARIMGEAEKILYEEFAYVLGIQPDEVLAYIEDKLAK